MSTTTGPASHRAAVFPGSTSSRYAQDWPARLTAPTAAIVLAAALLLGGGTMQGLPGDAIVIALGLLLAVLLVAAWPARALSPYRFELALLAAVLVLPLLQLLPLPPALWTALPGRAALAAQQATVGIAPHWAPLSLDPAGTWRAWLALLPGASLFVAALTLDTRRLERLTALIPLLALAGALLGFAQVAGGPGSPLRLFAYTQRGSAEGFFANRDHFADLLNVAMLLTAAWLIALWLQPRAQASGRALVMAAGWVTLAALLIGLLLTQSRAGVALGALTLLAIVVLAWRAGQAKPRLARRVAMTLLVIAMLSLQWGLYAVLARLHQDVFEDARWWIMRTTWIAAQHYGWLGSGIGSFVHVLPQFQSRATLIPPYVNHAHDDYLELWLEGGIPALLLMLTFVAWWVTRSLRAWRMLPAMADADAHAALPMLLRCAAAVGMLVLLLHASVDYALRTLALEATLAVLCAWLARRHLDTVSARDAHRSDMPPSPTARSAEPSPLSPTLHTFSLTSSQPARVFSLSPSPTARVFSLSSSRGARSASPGSSATLALALPSRIAASQTVTTKSLDSRVRGNDSNKAMSSWPVRTSFLTSSRTARVFSLSSSPTARSAEPGSSPRHGRGA